MPATRAIVAARAALARALRDGLEIRGYLEVETPIAVPVAGQEPHLRPFETLFTPDLPAADASPRRLHLHTSPEYAMKRLLCRPGFERIFQLARVFRDGEISRTHNPEFTLLEFYATPGSAASIMADLEQLISEAALKLSAAEYLGAAEYLSAAEKPGAAAEQKLPPASTAPQRNGHGRGPRGPPISLAPPFERLTCREAFVRYAGFDPLELPREALAQAARTVGVRPADNASWDDLFAQVLVDKVEPCLGLERPTYLTEYPASQAALAKLKPNDPSVAERFELYAGGLELANGFSELNDAREQRARLEDEQGARRALGREVFPLDEKFLEALASMPDAGGVALGVDRLLMLLTGAETIAQVLLFPAAEEYSAARQAARTPSRSA